MVRSKLYERARNLANDVPAYEATERAAVRIAADYVNDAVKALNKGDLSDFIVCVSLAGKFIEDVPTPAAIAGRLD